MDRAKPPADANNSADHAEPRGEGPMPAGQHDEAATASLSDPGTPSDTPLASDPVRSIQCLNTLPSPLPSLPPPTMDLSSLRTLLNCTLCRRRLDAPTTLHCGHTVCTRHLASAGPACPVPDCKPATTPLPNIPSSSTVAYHPPSRVDPLPNAAPLAARTDVTITKVFDLLDRVQEQLDQLDASHPSVFKDDSDSSDNDAPHADQISGTATSTSVPRSRTRTSSSDSNGRPRKRRRRLPPTQPDEDEDDGDLLAHLRAQTVRQRSTRHDEPLLPPIFPPSSRTRENLLINFEKDLLTELTCEICFTLFYEPITTRCQHTFCSRCLHRSLDHSPTCPLCRQDLPPYIHDHPNNKLVLSLILQAFPALYEDRKETTEAEDRDARLDTPIFVCQLSFPGMPTLLHFFEPRYRLMLRRSLESPEPSFGMIMPPKPGAASPQTEYGTMLEIRSVQMLPDGRSLVETWGTYRFRILERGTLDGYMVGRIERIDDDPEDILNDGPPASEPAETSATGSAASSAPSSSTSRPLPSTSTSSPSSSVTPSRNPTNAALMKRCREFLDQLERGTAPWIVQRFSTVYGRVPTDISSFAFWVAAALPIDEHEKAKLLPIRNPRLRLLLVTHWIEQLNNNWWFSSGCVIL